MSKNSDTNASEPNRQSRRRQQTRQALLTAGQKLFARQGLGETTINEITDAADVGFGTFYLHFQSKEELYEEIMQASIAEFQRHIIAAVLQAEHPNMRMRIAVLEFLRYAYNNRDFVQLIDRAVRTGGQLHGFMSVTETIGSRIIMLAQPATLSWEQPEILGRMLTGMLRQAAQWWIDHNEPTPEEMTDGIIAVLTKGFFQSQSS